MPGHEILKGEKVSLWTITEKDVEILWKYFGDPRIRKYMVHRFSIIYYQNEVEWFKTLVENSDKKFVFEIIENKSNKLIGLIGIDNVDWINRYGELGYWLWKEYWGKGYMTEAVRLMLKYAFEYLNLNKLYARVLEPNKASQRVLEKNGFKLVGRLRKHEYVPEEGYVDVLIFDLLKEEFTSSKT